MNKMPYEEEASLSNRDNIQQENQTMKLDWNSGFGRSNLWGILPPRVSAEELGLMSAEVGCMHAIFGAYLYYELFFVHLKLNLTGQPEFSVASLPWRWIHRAALGQVQRMFAGGRSW